MNWDPGTLLFVVPLRSRWREMTFSCCDPLAALAGLILGVAGGCPIDVAVLLLYWYNEQQPLNRDTDRLLGDSLEVGPLSLRQLSQQGVGHRNEEGFNEREGWRQNMHEGALPPEGTRGEGLSSQEVVPWNGE